MLQCELRPVAVVEVVEETLEVLYVQAGGPRDVDANPSGASFCQLATVFFHPLVSFFGTEFVGRPIQYDAEAWMAYTYQFGISSPFSHVLGCVCEAVA